MLPHLRFPVLLPSGSRGLLTATFYHMPSHNTSKSTMVSLQQLETLQAKKLWKLEMKYHGSHNWSPTEIQRVMGKLQAPAATTEVKRRALARSSGQSSLPQELNGPLFEIGSRVVLCAVPANAIALLSDTLHVLGRQNSAPASVQWELCRVDIHGTEVCMQVFTNQAEADAAAKMYQDRGHHQVYFVKRVPDC